MKEEKLNQLQKSLEDGVITKEEYEIKKKEIDQMPEEKPEEVKTSEKEPEEVKFKSDKALIIGVAIIILLFLAVLGIRYLLPKQPETIDELHEWNLKGKLKPEQGYIYNGYSFVKYDDLWYTKMVSPQGSRLYNIQFRYGPQDVEDLNIKGNLDLELFNNATDYYVTFNPNGSDFSHIALAVADFNTHMTKIFFKAPIAACDKNVTSACWDRPIITCENTDKIVLYVKEADKTNVYYDDNCIVVEGSGLELVKGIDRILYDFYDMI